VLQEEPAQLSVLGSQFIDVVCAHSGEILASESSIANQRDLAHKPRKC
jgi:hypothetical protein